MTILEHLERWRAAGAIGGAQYETLDALVRKDRFSVFVELNAILYLGVLAFVGGVGWTIKTHFASLGDAVILSSLTLIFGFSLHYCFSRGRAYSNGRVDAHGFAFDYVLYLGCLVLGIELGYVESQFHLLEDGWTNYLLLSSAVFFALAYRFDNRFVLSLALSTLAGWFSLRLSNFPDVSGPSLRASALIYGCLVALCGTALYRAGIKKHFLEAYLQVAANVLFVALVSALFNRDADVLYLLGLLGLAGIAVALGVRFKRFAFVVYGTVYGYIGISARVIDEIDTFTAALAYVAISGTIMIVTLVVIARRFGREA